MESYATACRIFANSISDGSLIVEQCLAIDNVCHGQEDHDSDFFFMYTCLFMDSHVHVPFDEFTIGVLCTLNVAPTQLHPTISWESLLQTRYSAPGRMLAAILPVTPHTRSAC